VTAATSLPAPKFGPLGFVSPPQPRRTLASQHPDTLWQTKDGQEHGYAATRSEDDQSVGDAVSKVLTRRQLAYVIVSRCRASPEYLHLWDSAQAQSSRWLRGPERAGGERLPEMAVAEACTVSVLDPEGHIAFVHSPGQGKAEGDPGCIAAAPYLFDAGIASWGSAERTGKTGFGRFLLSCGSLCLMRKRSPACGRSSGVESLLPKQVVAGSNPAARSNFTQTRRSPAYP